MGVTPAGEDLESLLVGTPYDDNLAASLRGARYCSSESGLEDPGKAADTGRPPGDRSPTGDALDWGGYGCCGCRYWSPGLGEFEMPRAAFRESWADLSMAAADS